MPRDCNANVYLLEYSKSYSKTSDRLFQYLWDAIDNQITDSGSCKMKTKITASMHNNASSKNVEIILPSKYLSNFWRNFGLLLNDWQANLMTWSENCLITGMTT